ncbi:MAG: efflux RND transporter periplasmic adaptor subunit [Bacteroidota bacterium]|nr:efflux RND transporter periplasmic adaptor subunit [Bacteroidota bacterium]MDP3145659.1 efflux RND transporter periplasmic adaptor subunit [Bacteroidota bacterium]MDP3558667.1 efflux RND transporter periplasmic adaptor subunit [Bacteroidota bacterium]
MQIFKFFIIPVLIASLFSCKSKPTDTAVEKFTMTDTMMNRCHFLIVKKEAVKNQLKLFGKITADNNRLAQVYPIMGGNVIQINVELGDYVKQGQVLATVRSGDVAQLKKEKLDAISDLALAEKNLQVAKDLYSGKLNSEKDVTASEKELEKAKAEVQRINEVYSIFHLSGGTIYDIISPMDGFIVFKDLNRNELLRSDKSDIIFSIAQIDEVWAVANVNESDISKIKVGYDANVQTIAYPNESFTGKIDKVFNAIDPETKAMKAVVKIKNSDLKLKPEMNATINLNFLEDKQLVAIPSSAIIFDKNKNWVMVFKNKSDIETRQIKIHNQIEDIVYIESGLTEGEKIISENGLLIYDALND